VVLLVEWLDVARVVVPTGAAVAILIQLARGFPEWVRGEIEVAKIKASGEARVEEIRATNEADIAKIKAISEAKIAEVLVAHDLQLTLERDQARRPRRQLEPVRPPPSRR